MMGSPLLRRVGELAKHLTEVSTTHHLTTFAANLNPRPEVKGQALQRERALGDRNAKLLRKHRDNSLQEGRIFQNWMVRYRRGDRENALNSLS